MRRLDNRHLLVDPLEERQMLAVDVSTSYDIAIAEHILGSESMVSGQSIATDNAGDIVATWQRRDSAGDTNIYARYLTDQVERVTLPAEIFEQGAGAKIKFKLYLPRETTGDSNDELTTSPAADEWENPLRWEEISINPITLGTASETTYNATAITNGMLVRRGAGISPIDFTNPAAGGNPWLGAQAYTEDTVQVSVNPVTSYSSTTGETTVMANQFDITYTGSLAKRDLTRLDHDGTRMGCLVVEWVQDARGQRWTLADGSSGSVELKKVSSPEFRVNSPEPPDPVTGASTAVNQTSAAVAVDADGDFVITWTSAVPDAVTPGSVRDIYARRFSPQSYYADPASLGVDEQPMQSTDLYSNVVLTTLTDSDTAVFTISENSYLRAGDTVDVYWPSSITEGNGVRQQMTVLNVATGAGGTAVTLDLGYGANLPSAGTAVKLLGYEWVNGVQALGNEFRVNTFTTNSQANAHVAMNDVGDFVVVWSDASQDQSFFNGVRAQRFNQDGQRVGNEWRVNREDTAEHINPYVAMTSETMFAVVWETVRGSNFRAVNAEIYDFNAAPAPVTVDPTQGPNWLYSQFVVQAPTLLATGLQLNPTAAFDSQHPAVSGAYGAGYNLVIAWDETRPDPVANNGGRMDVMAIQYRVDIAPVAGATTPTILRGPWRVNSATFNLADRATWPLEQQHNQAATDADGDLTIVYDGYGPDVFEANVINNAQLAGAANDVLFSQFDSSTYTAENPYTGYTTVLSTDNVANAYRDGQNQIYRLTLDGRTTGGTFVLTLESLDQSNGFLIGGTESVTVAVATTNMDTVSPVDPSTNIINRPTTGTNIDTALQNAIRTGRNWTGTTATSNSSVLVTLRDDLATATAVNDSHLLNIYSLTPSITGNFTLRLDTVRDQRVTANIRFDYEDLTLTPSGSTDVTTRTQERMGEAIRLVLVSLGWADATVSVQMLTTTTTPAFPYSAVQPSTTGTPPLQYQFLITFGGTGDDGMAFKEYVRHIYQDSIPTTFSIDALQVTAASLTAEKEILSFYGSGDMYGDYTIRMGTDSEVQTISFASETVKVTFPTQPSSGAFKLAAYDQVTGGLVYTRWIDYSATAAQVESALNAVSAISSYGGKVSVKKTTEEPGDAYLKDVNYYVTFQGDLADGDQPLNVAGNSTPTSVVAALGYDVASMTPSMTPIVNSTATATSLQVQGTGRNEVQRITIPVTGITTGSFVISYDPDGPGAVYTTQNTISLPYGASAAQVQSALMGLSNIYNANGAVIVRRGGTGLTTSSPLDPWYYDVVFIKGNGFKPIGNPTAGVPLNRPGVFHTAFTFAASADAAVATTGQVAGPTSGFWTASFRGETTVALAYSATAAQVETALNSLSTIGGIGGTVSVAQGSTAHSYTIIFGGELSMQDVPEIEVASYTPSPLVPNNKPAVVQTTMGAQTATILFDSSDLNGTAQRIRDAIAGMKEEYSGVQVVRQTVPDTWPEPQPKYQFVVTFAGESAGVNAPTKYQANDVIEDITASQVTNWAEEGQTLRIDGLGSKPWGLFKLSIADPNDSMATEPLVTPYLFFDYTALPDTATAIESALNQLLGLTGIEVTVLPANLTQTYYDFTINFKSDAAAFDFAPVQVAEAPHPFSLTAETTQVSTSEVQYLNFYGAPTSVTLSVGSYTTSAITFTSTDLTGTATLMQTALRALGFDGTLVTVQSPVEPFPVAGTPNYQFRVEFAGKSTGKNLPDIGATVAGATFALSPTVSQTQLLNFYGDMSSDFDFVINGTTVTYHTGDATTTAQELAAALGGGATVTHGTVPADYPYSYVENTDAEPTVPDDQFRIVFATVTRVLTDEAPYSDITAPAGISIKAAAKDPNYGPRDGLPEIQEIQFYSPTPDAAQGYFTLYCGEEYLPSAVIRKIETSLIYFDVNDPLHTQWNIETALSNLAKYDGTRVGYDGVDVQYMESTLSTPPVGSAGRYRVIFGGASSYLNIPDIEQADVPVSFTYTSTERVKGSEEVQHLNFYGPGTMEGWFTLISEGTETGQMYFDPSNLVTMQETIEDELGKISGAFTQEIDFGSETDLISFTSTPMDGTWSITFSYDWNNDGDMLDLNETGTATFRYDATRYQIQEALNALRVIKGPSATNPGYVYVSNAVDSSGSVITTDYLFTFRGALSNKAIATTNFSLDRSHLHTVLADGSRPVVTIAGAQGQNNPTRQTIGSAAALTGTWSLSFMGLTTTPVFTGAATAAEVQSALNALSTVADLGGVTVTTSPTDADNYIVTFNHKGEVGAVLTVNRTTGAVPYVMSDYVGVTVESQSATAPPSTLPTYQFKVTWEAGTVAARQDVPLIEAGIVPVGFEDTQVAEGATVNEVQHLNFYGPATGLFTLVIDGAVANDDGTWGTGTPMGIHFYASNLGYTASLIQEALSRVSNFAYNGVTVAAQAVTAPPTAPALTPEYQFRITFGGRMAGIDVSTITMGAAPVSFSADSNSYTQGRFDAIYDVSFIGEAHDRAFELTGTPSVPGLPLEEEAIITINIGQEGYFALGLAGVGGKSPDIFFDPKNPWQVAAAIESGLRGLLNPNPTFDRLYVKYIDGSTYRFRVTFGGTLAGNNQPDIQTRTPDHVYDRNNPLDDPNLTQISIFNNNPMGTNTPLTHSNVNLQNGWRGKSQAYPSIGMEPDGDFALSWVQYTDDLVNVGGAAEALFVRRFDESTDTAGPRITDILSTDGERVADGEQMNDSPSYLIVTFDEEMMTNASAVSRVTNLDNWTLLLNGVAVSGGIVRIEYGMNRAQELGLATGSNKYEAVLFLDGDATTYGIQDLADGNYQLIARNTLRDRNGNPLGRTGWQIQGAAWTRSFSVFGLGQDEIRVNTNTDGSQPSNATELQSTRQVATDGDGDYVTVWTSSDLSASTNYGVFARVFRKQYDATTGEVVLGSDGKPTYIAYQDVQVKGGFAYEYAYASVACDEDGDFVVTWSQRLKNDPENYNWDIYYMRYDAAGNKRMSQPALVNAEREDIQKYSTVAMDVEGNFVITWQSLNQDESGYGIYAQRYGAAGETIGGTNEVQKLNFTGFNFADGHTETFYLTWEGEKSAAIVHNGDMAALADRVAEELGDFGLEVEVSYVVDPSLWVTFVGDSGGIDQPTIGIDLGTGVTGHIGVVTQTEGNPGEFLVNDTTANNQTLPDIAMADDGSFVITWTSAGQIGDEAYKTTNVYAKRFASSAIYAANTFQAVTVDQYSDTQGYVITTDAPANHVVTPPSGYDGVVQINETGGGQLGSGALLWTNTQILTAAHLFCDDQGRQIVNSVDVIFNTTAGVVSLTSTVIFIHPSYTGNLLLGGDLAIVNLPSTAPGNIQGYQIYTTTDEINKTFDLVGYGYGGQGTTPGSAASGVKRRGQNKFEMLGSGLRAPFGTSTSSVLIYDFDSGQPANDVLGIYYGLYDNGLGAAESAAVFGDSGGPLFINGRIAAIVSGGVTGLTADAVPGTNGSFGELGFDTRVSSFTSWIQQIAVGGGKEFLVNTTTADNQKWSSVAMDADGDFVVTWTSYNQDGVGTGYGGGNNGQEGVYAQRYDRNGNKVRTEFLVNTFADQQQQRPAVSMDSDGDFVVTWESFEDRPEAPFTDATTVDPDSPNSFGIYAQRYAANSKLGQTFLGANGEVGDETPVSKTKNGNQRYPSVSMDDGGSFVVVWSGNGTQPGQVDSQGIFSRRFATATDSSSPVVASIYDTTVYDPSVYVVYDPSNQYYQLVSGERVLKTVPSWMSSYFAALGDSGPYSPYIEELAQIDSTASVIYKASNYTSNLWPLWKLSNSADSFGNYDLLPQQMLENTSIQIVDRDADADVNPDGVTSFVVTFSEPLSEEGGMDGTHSILNPTNWKVTKNDQTLVNGITKVERVTAGDGKVAYKIYFDAYTDTAESWTWGNQPLDVGTYDLILLPNAQDIEGNSLDGNRDGVAGGQFLRNFTIVTGTGDPDLPPGDPVQNSFDAPLNANLASNQEQSAIARAPNGKYVVAWVSYGQNGDTTAQGNIMCQVFNEDGTKMGTEFVVNNYTLGNQTAPDVAFANGVFVVTWSGQGTSDGSTNIYARWFDYSIDNRETGGTVRYGVPQADQQQVNSYMLSVQSDPTVAMDGTGNVVVAWTSSPGAERTQGIYAQCFNTNREAQWRYSGGSTAPMIQEQRVSSYTAGAQLNSDVAMYETTGNTSVSYCTIVWQSDGQDGSGWGIFGKRLNWSNLDWSDAQQPDDIAEFQVNQHTANSQVTPQIAIDEEGNEVITWASWGQEPTPGSGYGIYARQYRAAGDIHNGQEFPVSYDPETYDSSDSDPQQYETVNNQFAPAVDMGENGAFAITWASTGQDNTFAVDNGVYCRLFSADGDHGYYRSEPNDLNFTFGDFRVNATVTGNQYEPAIACDEDGNVIVVWTGSDGSGTGILSRETNRVRTYSASSLGTTNYYSSPNASPAIAQSQLGITTPGLFDPAASVFYLRGDNSTGFADYTFGYGETNSGWTPVMGDWDGDGAETIGFYDPETSLFYLRNSNTVGYADYTFGFGAPGLGWLPLVGDWDGDGADSVGLYDPATSLFYLRNNYSAGYADICFGFGAPGAGWVPLMGDWNADGIDTLGLFDPSTSVFYLRNSNSFGYADSTFGYGGPNSGWVPMSGDWNSDGRDTIGFYMPQTSTFVLRNENSTGYADQTFGYGAPGAGWLPVVGQWDGPEFLHVDGAAAVAADATKVTDTQLPAIVTEAISRWSAAGIESSTIDILANTKVKVVDLPGEQLGMAHEGTVYLDVDAAGRGWFVDDTPEADEEYVENNGQLTAVTADAVDRIDLLTVVAHELGHIAGLDDVDASLDELMSSTLSTGLRRSPVSALTDAIFEEGFDD